jgi:hypothetical protein
VVIQATESNAEDVTTYKVAAEPSVTRRAAARSLGRMTPAIVRTRWRAPAPSTQTPDRRLVERMSGGDETAFNELFARYRRATYETAYAALLEPEEVEATVAAAFREARRTAVEFLASHCSVSGWLTHLTRLCVASRQPRLS